jgi:outer membrane autotransporter protein
LGFDRGVLFDHATGRLIGMGGVGPSTAKTYLNLNRSQTSVYLSLYEDAVEPGTQNVITGSDSARIAGARGAESDGIQFITGASNGDAQLVAALNLATFTNPGSIVQAVINRLSPEVHRGMADYTEQGLRSHVIEAFENAPESRYGETQVFATAHSGMERVDSSATGAGYDLDMAGVTTGLRYEMDRRLQIGGMLGMDFGKIEGPLVDTDAQGLALGLFGRYLIDEPHKVTLTASMAYGTYDYDTTRRSFGGDANADDVSSDALELAVGLRSVSYEKTGFRVLPNATLRYLTGKVDRFTENGPGVNLRVGSQDIDSLLLDLGVDFEYEVHRQVTLTGSVGYLQDFQDSENPVSGAFAAAGSLATPFTVSAPGVEDEAFVLGLGVFYDLNESARVGLSYSGGFQTSGEYAHRFGIGASFGF